MSPRLPLKRGNICAEVLSFEKCETAAVPSPLINQEHTLVNDLFVITVILTLEGCKIWNPLAFIRTSLSIETQRWWFFSSWPQMCLHWLAQCFWNYLDWMEICHYLSTCVLMGADYQVYACVAVFRHLQPEILQQTQAQELQLFLKVKRGWNRFRIELEGRKACCRISVFMIWYDLLAPLYLSGSTPQPSSKAHALKSNDSLMHNSPMCDDWRISVWYLIASSFDVALE